MERVSAPFNMPNTKEIVMSGTTGVKAARAATCAAAGLCSVWAGVLSAEAPAGWLDKCFGADNTGGAAYSESGGRLDITVTGAGTDIWGTSDTGRFVFTPLAGDCEIMATVPAIPQEALYSQWARQGLMMRGATLNNAEHISFFRNKGTPETGTRAEGLLRASHGAGTGYWSGLGNSPYATNAPARLRLVRQGDTYTGWASTNAPAYDRWERLGAHTAAFYRALNVGLVVSRNAQQTGGPDTLTCAFENVVARNLVTAGPDGGGIAVAWIGDTPVTNGTVVGYALERAAGPAGGFTALSETGPETWTYADGTAGEGTSYVYRVYASVEVGAATNRVLVGTSLPARRPAVAANPSPAAVKGVYAEYFNTALAGSPQVAARVDPNINNSWNYSGASVYPANTPNGLSELSNFQSRYAGSITVPETGCYGLADTADDSFYLWVDGVRMIAQDAWLNEREQSAAPVWLEAGRSYPVRVEHREGGGGEFAILRWSHGLSPTEVVPQSAFEPFPWPWQHRDVGDSPRFGNAVFDHAAQSFTVASGGLGVDPATGRSDVHFVWRELEEDFDLIARVAALEGPEQPGFGAGVAVQRSTADNAAAFALAVTAAGETGTERALGLMYRAADGAAPLYGEWPLDGTPPAELRLARRGTNLWAYYRTSDSGGWVGVTGVVTQLAGTLRAGLMAFSGDTAVTATGVFDRVTFAYPHSGFSATAAESQATVVANERPPMEARQTTNALPNIAYYWADHLNGGADTYTVYRSNRPDGGFEAVGETTRAGSFTYTETLPATNTLVFYRLGAAYALGALADGGTNDLAFLTKVFGVSDGSFPGTGAGLFAAFHRGAVPEAYTTNRPVHTMIRDLSGWEKGTTENRPMVAAAASDDGVQIGPDNFQVTWAGWLVPQYTGYHWFRTQTDDAAVLWVGGKRVIYQWGYTAAARDSEAVWLEAGRRVPVHIYFQQGTGGGYFRIWWKHGLGFEGGFVAIPTEQLLSNIPDGAPLAVAPGTADAFGPWRNIDINTGRPGHAVLGGTPEAFDCTVTGSGADIWGTADGLHFLYREVAENFAFEATFNSLLLASDGWAKAGLMVRDGTSAGARNVFLMTTIDNGYRLQYRAAADGGSTSYLPTEIAPTNVMGAATPVTFKLVRERGKVKMYIDGTHVTFAGGTDYDISGWSRNLCVGIALTSHNNGRLNASFVSDVAFTVNYPQGSVLLMK
jgi:hypothetical protein